MTRAFLYMCLVALPASGCILYSSDDDCDDEIDYGGGAGGLSAPIAPVLLLDPSSGQCIEFSGGGGGGGGGGACDDAPPSTRDADEPEGVPEPDWASCQSACTGLDESTCQATPACRAAYVGECPADASCAPGDAYVTFFECWATAPSGPVQGQCGGLDGYECSRHDDCAAIHWPAGTGTGQGGASPGEDQALVPGIGSFYTCVAEDTDVPPVDHCYGEVSCRSLPPECPDGTRPGIYGSCWSGDCVPLDECPEGVCLGDVDCDVAAPPCDDDSTPGVADGCYTGYCIPTNQCELDPRPCGELGEVACVGRSDCAPYYEGVDCTCAGDACVCEEWLFQSCQAS